MEIVLGHIRRELDNGNKPIIDPTLAARGKLFTKADFHPTMLRVNYELFDDDVVDHYLAGTFPSRNVRFKRVKCR